MSILQLINLWVIVSDTFCILLHPDPNLFHVHLNQFTPPKFTHSDQNSPLQLDLTLLDLTISDLTLSSTVFNTYFCYLNVESPDGKYGVLTLVLDQQTTEIIFKIILPKDSKNRKNT